MKHHQTVKQRYYRSTIVSCRSSFDDRRSMTVSRSQTIFGRRSSFEDLKSLVDERQSQVDDRQLSIVGRRSTIVGLSVVGRRSSTDGRRPTIVCSRSWVTSRHSPVMFDRFSRFSALSNAAVMLYTRYPLSTIKLVMAQSADQRYHNTVTDIRKQFFVVNR